MSVREWINNNSAAATAAAVVLLCVALGVIVWSNTGGPGGIPRDGYFYDLSSEELFVHRLNEYPPVIGPSNEQAGVRAYVYACGECPRSRDIVGLSWQELREQTDAFVGRFERWPERARAVLSGEIEPEDEYEQMELELTGPEVRTPDQDRWVPQNGAAEDMSGAHYGDGCPGGELPTYCLPGG